MLARPGTGFAYLGFNLRSGPLADVRVRRAMCHAVRRGADRRAQVPRAGGAGHGHAPAHALGLRAERARLPVRPGRGGEAARRGGLPGSGRAGRQPRLRLSLQGRRTDRFRRSVALVLQEQLSRMAWRWRCARWSSARFFNDIRRELRALSAQVGLGHRAGPAARRVPLEERAHGGEPLGRPEPGRTQDPELDALLDQAEPGRAPERKALYAGPRSGWTRAALRAAVAREHVAVVSRRLRGLRAQRARLLHPAGSGARVEP